MKKSLIIKDRNKMIRFRNRQVRTPVILEVTDAEISNLKIALKMADIHNYSVQIIPLKGNKYKAVLDLEDVEVVIEELDLNSDSLEPDTILEKLMKDGEK